MYSRVRVGLNSRTRVDRDQPNMVLPWLNFWAVRAGISRLLFILVVNFFAFVPESRRNNGDEKI